MKLAINNEIMDVVEDHLTTLVDKIIDQFPNRSVLAEVTFGCAGMTAQTVLASGNNKQDFLYMMTAIWDSLVKDMEEAPITVKPEPNRKLN